MRLAQANLLSRLSWAINPRQNFSAGTVGGYTGGSGGLYTAAQASRFRQRPAMARAQDSKRDLSGFTREELLKLGRYVYANSGFAGGAVDDMKLYSIGEHGLTPYPLTSNKPWNLSARLYFEDWWLRSDISYRHNFLEQQEFVCTAIDYDGEIFALPVRDDEDEPRVQLVRAHRVGQGVGEHTPFWVDGVHLDEYNRALEYRVLTGWDWPATQWKDVPAHQVLHIGDGDFPDEVRYPTRFKRAINHLRDLEDITGFAKVSVKLEQAIAAVIKCGFDDTDPHETDDSLDEDGKPTATNPTLALDQIIGGHIPRLRAGEEIQFLDRKNPNGNFVPLMEFFMRDVATSLGLPFEFVWDPKSLTGSNNRMIIAKVRRRCHRRATTLVDKFCSPVWNYVIGDAMNRGKLPLNPEYRKVRWQGGQDITVDAGRDAQQVREDIKFGTWSKDRDAQSRGTNREQIMDEQDESLDALFTRARKLAKKHGVSMDKALEYYEQRSANPPSNTDEFPEVEVDGQQITTKPGQLPSPDQRPRLPR